MLKIKIKKFKDSEVIDSPALGGDDRKGSLCSRPVSSPAASLLNEDPVLNRLLEDSVTGPTELKLQLIRSISQDTSARSPTTTSKKLTSSF